MRKYLILTICILLMLSGCINFEIKDLIGTDSIKDKITKKDTPEDVLNKYLILWEDGEYGKMYDLISSSSKEKVTRQNFIDKYKDIFDTMGLVEMESSIKEPTEDGSFPLTITFHTNTVPTFEQKYTIALTKEEGKWKLAWSPRTIFPDMREGHTIKLEKSSKVRGQIQDRYGEVLAKSSNVYTVGAVPRAIPDTDKFIEALAPIIDVSKEYIKAQLNQKWVTDDSFVPLRSYPLSISQEFKDEVLAVKGVMLSSKHKWARQYMKGPQLAHITGYVQNISKEQLDTLADKGYTQEDIIGRQGIEASMESAMRQRDGYVMTMGNEDSEDREIIAEYEGENGHDIILTIDSTLQEIAYEAMEGYKGSIIALQPKTGEVLAMASLPSFDPNMFSFGISQKDWDKLSNDEDYPLVNRVVKGHIPGSTVKPFIAAMGLEEGVITPDTIVEEARNKEWLPSPKWGNHPIRRVDHPDGDVDLRNALVWSDNIYFAWAGLKLGKAKLESYAAQYGIGENMPFDLKIDRSQIKGKSTDWSEQLVADTAYGQGEVLIAPAQLASMFTAFVNDGDILNAQLIKEVRASSGEIITPFERKVWKSGAMKKETVNTIVPYLIDVVEDKTGTAHALHIPELKIAAKTGTSQLGKNKNEELSWLVAFTIDEEKPLLVAICLEVVEGEGRAKFDIAKNIFKKYYNR